MLWPGENCRKSPCSCYWVKHSRTANWVTHGQSATSRRRHVFLSLSILEAPRNSHGCSKKPTAMWPDLHMSGLSLRVREHLRKLWSLHARSLKRALNRDSLRGCAYESVFTVGFLIISRSCWLQWWDFITLRCICLRSLTWLVAQHAKKKKAFNRIGEPFVFSRMERQRKISRYWLDQEHLWADVGGQSEIKWLCSQPRKGLGGRLSGSPEWRGGWRLTCDPDSLSGGCQSPLSLCLGMGLSGRGSAQAQVLGAPSCKNTIYNTKSKPKTFCFYIMYNSEDDAKALSGRTIR